MVIEVLLQVEIRSPDRRSPGSSSFPSKGFSLEFAPTRRLQRKTPLFIHTEPGDPPLPTHIVCSSENRHR